MAQPDCLMPIPPYKDTRSIEPRLYLIMIVRLRYIWMSHEVRGLRLEDEADDRQDMVAATRRGEEGMELLGNK